MSRIRGPADGRCESWSHRERPAAPETEPVEDAEDEPWDGYPMPVIEFPVYGCDETWTGPRWLEFVQFHHHGMDSEAITEVWTAHGDSRMLDPASPSIRVGTLPLKAAERQLAGPDHDVARAAAFTAAFTLLDRTEPELPDPQRDQLRRASIGMVDDLADDWANWPTVSWHIDGRPGSAHVTAWAGAWAAVCFDMPGVAIIVIANGVQPAALRLAAAGDGHAYHVDLRQPLNYPRSLEASAHAALGDDPEHEPSRWPLHPDHDRLLGRLSKPHRQNRQHDLRGRA
jgi:hypothetical protein